MVTLVVSLAHFGPGLPDVDTVAVERTLGSVDDDAPYREAIAASIGYVEVGRVPQLNAIKDEIVALQQVHHARIVLQADDTGRRRRQGLKGRGILRQPRGPSCCTGPATP